MIKNRRSQFILLFDYQQIIKHLRIFLISTISILFALKNPQKQAALVDNNGHVEKVDS